MKPSLLPAFLLTVSTLACGTTTEPANDGARPTAVSIVDASAGDGSVTITFTQTTSAAPASVQYRVTCQGSGLTYTASGNASPITVTGMTNGLPYTCTVSAVDTNGSSDPSSAVVLTPRSVAPPPVYMPSLFFLLSPGNGSAIVDYDIPLGLLDRPWLVTVTCNAAGLGPIITTRTDSVVGVITIAPLQNGVTYSCSYSITSASGVVISAQRDVVPGTPTRPGAPGVTPGNASLTVSFGASLDNGSPVTGYTATCAATGQETRTANGASSPLVVTGLTNGVAYSCDVYGSNALGPGEKGALQPMTPGIPAAVGPITITTTSNSATFSFSPPADNGSPITNYTFWCDPFGPGGGVGLSGTASPITIAGLRSGWPYTCRVFATNANGDGLPTYVYLTTQ